MNTLNRPTILLFYLTERMKALRLLAVLVFVANAQSLFGCVTNVIPFGVTTNVLAGKTIGDSFLLSDAGITSGQEGKIDLVGYQNVPDWDDDMLRLGCGTCNICVGQFPVITGNAHVSQDFNAINGSTFIMPIVDKFVFSGNSGLATIVGFVSVQLLDSRGSGANWTATLQLLNVFDVDSDGDGVPDNLDLCPDTAHGASVDTDGCSIDQLVPCSGPRTGGAWGNHGAYVSAVAKTANQFLAAGLTTEAQRDALVSQAAESNCGKR